MESRGRARRHSIKRAGLLLGTITVAYCLALHIATFFTVVSFVWLLPTFASIGISIVLSKAVPQEHPESFPYYKVQWLGLALLAYSLLLFAYDLKRTGGASGVEVIDGQYFSEYRGKIIRQISEYEYLFFPNLWARVMSAWMGMMAVFATAGESSRLGRKI